MLVWGKDVVTVVGLGGKVGTFLVPSVCVVAFLLKEGYCIFKVIFMNEGRYVDVMVCGWVGKVCI